MALSQEARPDTMDVYRATARARWEQGQRSLEQRRVQAWEVARRAARLLRDEFQATRVAAFGSLVRDGGFTPWSDIDLAVWGIAPEDTFRAVAAAMGLDPDIEVNVVDVETCRPSLRAVIDREGIEL